MAQTQYTVFLTDDDEDDTEMLTTALHKETCIAAVLCFPTTPELVRKLDTLSFALLPDLIVMDHHKPPYGEGELVRYIRSQKRMDSIALIVYTTIIQERKKNTMLHDGVDCAMTKGNTTQEIADHVAIFCQVIADKKSSARDRRTT